MTEDLTLEQYRALAEFRYLIRKFLRFSAEEARTAGLSTQQHQLLLAVRGLPDGLRPTIRTLAERMQLAHHSTVELVDRLVLRGFLRRDRSAADRREVALALTAAGARVLRRLSLAHRGELRSLIPAKLAAFERLGAGRRRGRNA